ncbi:MAG: DUF4389 domain-containing protein [Chloroflexi bacterium]|nr:MAG: DUF4389 domain-containing protein [Chloroflexota bacterium]
MKTTYPVTFSIDFPDRDLDRVSTAFRIFAVIPIGIILSLLSGASLRYATTTNGTNDTVSSIATGGGLLFLPLVLMILFRQKYPRWWFDWNLQLLRFSNRVTAYLGLLDDRYPSTDEEQAVHLDLPYPDARQLNRWLPLVKWLLAIPHYIVLFFLVIGAVVAVIVAWFAILFTGRYPRGLFDYVVGVIRWSNRVTGYAMVLVTDEYPPFSLE